MTKHPPADDTEATLAALAYLPGLAPVLYLTLAPGRGQRFLRYHIGHAFLLALASFLALGLVALIGLLPQAPAFAYAFLGIGMSVVLIGSTVLHLVAGVQAYRKRFVVLPILTPLYYRLSRHR